MKSLFFILILIIRLFYCTKDKIGLNFCHYDRTKYSYRTC